jgi:pyruvate/2-oxoglutarate dehydrogenase complex dihydrolipoamide acyltransferase (E2) component
MSSTTAIDFTIKPGETVWLHGQPWRAGQERDLQKASFSREEKRSEARCGSIDYFRSDDEGADVNATEGAITLAEIHEVNLSEVLGTGKGGKISQRDVQKYVDARAVASAEAPTTE